MRRGPRPLRSLHTTLVRVPLEAIDDELSSSEGADADACGVAEALARLPEAERLVLELYYEVACPPDWADPWPPRLDGIGRYVGTRCFGHPVSWRTALRLRREGIARCRGLL